MNAKNLFFLSLATVSIIAVLAFYEWRISVLNSKISELDKTIGQLEDVISQKEAEPAKNAEKIPQNNESYYPPVNHTQSNPSPTQTDNFSWKNKSMQELFESKNTDTQSELDSIKRRYEDLLVTYFLLKKCEKITESDYPIIMSSLQKSLSKLNAEDKLQYDILTAAKGSFEEIYSKTNCDAAQIESTLAQYNTYLQKIK